MAVPDVTVVVPWRGGCPYREAAWRWVQRQYREHHPDWPIIIGEHDNGRWRKALAVDSGVAATQSPVVLIADADVWCDGTGDIVAGVLAGESPWGVPHRLTVRLAQESSAAVLRDEMRIEEGELEQPAYRAHPGGGLVVIRRNAWGEVPLDPRFQGWGSEDDSWALALRMLLGPQLQGHRRLYHLWHPPQERMYRALGSYENEALFNRYHAARTPEAMEVLLDEFRGTQWQQPSPLTTSKQSSEGR